jgi:glutaredoxin-like YruB-family protein
MKVRLFGLPTCPWCRKTREYLENLGVDYEDIDVSQNRAMAKEMIKNTDQKTVPVVQIGDSWVVGFDEDRLSIILRNSGAMPDYLG